MVAVERLQHRPHGEKQQHAQNHHVTHVGGARRADENAVELKAPDADDGHQRRPDEVLAPRQANIGTGRHEVDDKRPGKPDPDGQQQARCACPQRRQEHRLAEAGLRARADRLTDEAFGGEGEAVEQIDRHHRDGVEHGVGGERYVPRSRTLCYEEHEHRQRAQGADHDVGVDLERPLHAADIQHLAERGTGTSPHKVRSRQHQPKKCGRPLG